MKAPLAPPRLEIRSLGVMELELDGKIVRADELSPSQREFLGLLLARPDLDLPLEELQCLLWPESPPERSRSNLDTLLSRFRALLDSHFRPHSSKNYLTLSKGILRLENCRFDGRDFLEGIHRGLAHARRQDYPNAQEAFRSAFSLWGGTFEPEGHEALLAFREELEQLHLEAALVWSEYICECGNPEEGIEIVKRALKLDRTHDRLVKNLYRLQVKSGQSAEAAQVLREYRCSLEQEGFSPDEIEDIFELFWN